MSWFKIENPVVGMEVSYSDINLWGDRGTLTEIVDRNYVLVKWRPIASYHSTKEYLPSLIEWREPRFPDECSHYPGRVCYAQHTISHDACRAANKRPQKEK